MLPAAGTGRVEQPKEVLCPGTAAKAQAGKATGLPESTTEESDVNITSEEEEPQEQPAQGPCGPREKDSGGPIPRAIPESQAVPPEGPCCYICGSALSPASQHEVHVQKQERLPQAPFFPFLWLHSPPPGAQPISEAGSTLVCPCCFESLQQQWQSFELAGVPVLQRLYVVPLNSRAPGMASKGRRPRRDEGLPCAALPEACYLCGEDCSPDARAVPSRVLNGSARGTMHFPFLSLLPCPPNARAPNKRSEVRSCPKCFSVLEDVWALYRACQNQELITSVQGFLGRYHQAFSASDPAICDLPASAPGAPASVCYICGVELGPGKEFQLNVNPASRLGEREPFFPFLTVYPPAPRARPADATGLVATCVLCYHDLLSQWLHHEAQGTHHAVSAWSRQYQVDTFVCFFCQQEKRRCLGLTSVRVARLPLFLYTLRASHSLLVDDGRQLIIGACLECGTLVCAGQGLTRPGPMGWSSPVATARKMGSAHGAGKASVALQAVSVPHCWEPRVGAGSCLPAGALLLPLGLALQVLSQRSNRPSGLGSDLAWSPSGPPGPVPSLTPGSPTAGHPDCLQCLACACSVGLSKDLGTKLRPKLPKQLEPGPERPGDLGPGVPERRPMWGSQPDLTPSPWLLEPAPSKSLRLQVRKPKPREVVPKAQGGTTEASFFPAPSAPKAGGQG
ncbi:hypothetical protein H920_06721 [Fukomys damarensis]|uniref:Genetic suppressor element 1 n=1 Tax=Fukomys damarensis TaxID=885580 RepID=A0A091DNI6_FUKDA|nr:hypothetical protein H920_06721 [Fukomys damarensis]